MFLDFTKKVLFLSAEQCYHSVVVRVRAVENNDFSVWYLKGDHREKKGQALILTTLGPAKEYIEGGDQKIWDILIRPPPAPHAGKPNDDVHSYRVVSAIPAIDHPWTTQEHWLTLHFGDPARGIFPKIWVQGVTNVIIDIPDYRVDSTTLPDSPFKLPEPPEVITFWDRIANEA